MPYAVYGTLRSGYGNDTVWHGLGESFGLGTITGYKLVTNGGFPYALPASSEVTVVEIIVPFMEYAEELRQRLDWLEGYPDLYSRREEQIHLTDEDVNCIMYVPPQRDHAQLANLATVPKNDWSLWSRRLEYAI
jgi:gamma-glutamylcyclotransferase (GGCT)/AIG2-like uncharacterized protein YtfP